MTTIACPSCQAAIEITKALEGQIQEQVLTAARQDHAAELAKVRAEATSTLERQLSAEREIIRQQSATDLEIERRRLAAEAENTAKRLAQDQELAFKSLTDDAAAAKADAAKMRTQLSELMTQLREANLARDDAKLAAQKQLAQDESRIREEATRAADERQRLELSAKNKTIEDLQKALDSAQRKAAQGSQQLQGEVLELDFEQGLANAFPGDAIEPVAKGTRGGDVAHTVHTPQGHVCGLIIWELKRTKNWSNDWVPKLKADMRSARANLAVIVTEAMPKDIQSDLTLHEGVWLCKPALALALGQLLRQGLLDVARTNALAERRSTHAESLYSYVTSHEFSQQIELMVETYRQMNEQVLKERVAYEKLWSQREKQASALLTGTANIIGSMQGYIGGAAMPRIKGLELLSDGLAEDAV